MEYPRFACVYHPYIAHSHRVRNTTIDTLKQFSPRVEMNHALEKEVELSMQDASIFVDALGMMSLFGNIEKWSRCLYTKVRKCFPSEDVFVSVAFDKYNGMAINALMQAGFFSKEKRKNGFWLSKNKKKERRIALSAPVSMILRTRSRKASKNVQIMEHMGIFSLRDLVQVPRDELRRRFGGDMACIHDLFNEEIRNFIVAHKNKVPLKTDVYLDFPLFDMDKVRCQIESCLQDILQQRIRPGYAICELRVALFPSPNRSIIGSQGDEEESENKVRKNKIEFTVVSTSASRSFSKWKELIAYRMESVSLGIPVDRISVSAAVDPIDNLQHNIEVGVDKDNKKKLFAEDAAVSKIKAMCGKNSVFHYILCDRYIPEDRQERKRYTRANHMDKKFRKAKSDRNGNASTEESFPWDSGRMIRRMQAQPTKLRSEILMGLSKQAGIECLGRLPQTSLFPKTPSAPPRDAKGNRIFQFWGPYRLSAAWWSTEEQARDYYYAETLSGEILWLFYNPIEEAWYQHGYVD